MKVMFFFVTVLFFANSSFALLPTEIATVQDSECRQDVTDASDVGFRNTENSILYGKQCIDGTRFRPILNFKVEGDELVFDNYLHNDKYWRARVPYKQIDAVFFQIMRFPVVEGVEAAHTQIRFRFREGSPVQLSRGSSETATNNDILVSFEAAFPVGIKYDFAKGAFPNYPRVGKIMSTAQKQSYGPENAIEQYDLKLTAEEVTQLLKNSLEYSFKIGMNEFYNTRRPNCTTEVFDLIDQLPRFQNNFAKFMTVISPDPIAGPSIKALERRDLIKARVQNFSDEVKGIFTILPVPEVKNAFASFLPQVEGREWALVTVLPDNTQMTETEKAALESLQAELVQSIPALIQSYGSVMILSPEGEKGKGLFLSTLKEFAQRLPSVLRRMNDKLPSKPTPVRVYFVPDVVKKQAPNATFWDMELPFRVQSYQVTNSKKNEGATLAHIAEGFAAAGAKGLANQKAAFMMGAAILVNAQKDNAKVTSQAIVGLEKMQNDMNSSSPQVVIEKIVIPETGVDGDQHVSMVISHEQNVAATEAAQKVNEEVNVRFGPFRRLGDKTSPLGVGSLVPYSRFSGCYEINDYTPRFEGRINDQFLGDGWLSFLNPILDGGGISFHLTALDMNLKTQTVTNMDLSITLWPGFFEVGCLEDENADKQFAENANKAIKDLINKAGENPILKQLSPLLN